MFINFNTLLVHSTMSTKSDMVAKGGRHVHRCHSVKPPKRQLMSCSNVGWRLTAATMALGSFAGIHIPFNSIRLCLFLKPLTAACQASSCSSRPENALYRRGSLQLAHPTLPETPCHSPLGLDPANSSSFARAAQQLRPKPAIKQRRLMTLLTGLHICVCQGSRT